jgi:hypothetical protein
MQVVIDKKTDFARATNKKGVTVNGINYRRFVGTTGGLKNNTLLFCNSEYIDKLNELCECRRNKEVPLVPATLCIYPIVHKLNPSDTVFSNFKNLILRYINTCHISFIPPKSYILHRQHRQ